jgi:Zn-dependent protease with chaperone function
MEFLRKLNINGYIIVSSFKQDDLPHCGLASSMEVGGFGMVFVEKSALESDTVPERLKDFIIAHEVAHIVRGHIVVYAFTRTSFGAMLEAVKDVLESALKSKKPEDFILGLLLFLLFKFPLAKLAEVDAETVKKQELEADNIAVQLAGREGALLFAKWLGELKRRGYDVSHESVLGFPALTIEERISNLLQQCHD